jgi:hypothetical protein
LARVAKLASQGEPEKKPEAKAQKKKAISKEKFQYKFTAHEKQLAELSEYRAFFPHLTATGPQFQADLPHLRLLDCKCGSIIEKESWLRVRREKLEERLKGVQRK